MKIVALSSEERALHELLKQASEENLILRTTDGREFILAEIDDFDREIELTRQNEDLMRLLDARGQEQGTVPLAEARARLGAAQE
jgi:hypothetical protein